MPYDSARYYDPTLGRFISADSIVPGAGALTVAPNDPVAARTWGQRSGGPSNPQQLNRYSYVLNNPIKNTDPTGHDVWQIGFGYTVTAGPFSYSAGVSIAVDSSGNIAVVSTHDSAPIGEGSGIAPGIAGGNAAGPNLSFSYNSAPTIDGITGRGLNIGGSARAGIDGLGVSATPSVSSDTGKPSTIGVTVHYAPGGGLEGHASHTYTTIHGRVNVPEMVAGAGSTLRRLTFGGMCNDQSCNEVDFTRGRSGAPMLPQKKPSN